MMLLYKYMKSEMESMQEIELKINFCKTPDNGLTGSADGYQQSC